MELQEAINKLKCFAGWLDREFELNKYPYKEVIVDKSYVEAIETVCSELDKLNKDDIE